MVFLIEQVPLVTSWSSKRTKVLPLDSTNESGDDNSLALQTPTLAKWLSFDLAEDMEMGCADEVIPDNVLLAEDEAEPARRLLLAFSQDRQEYNLINDDSESVLVARSSSSKSSFEINVPKDGLIRENKGPDFLLKKSRNVWTLTSLRGCQSPNCGGRLLDPTSLVRICHFKNAGDCTDQGSEVDICTPKNEGISRGGFDFDKLYSESPEAQSSTTETFQLRRKGDHDEAVEALLTFKEVSENLFSLRYRHPLSMVQAFAVALTRIK
jgi:hypothetical protein